MVKVYHLQRKSDVSGVSGVGEVALCVEFPDGKCVIQWQREIKSLTVYNSLEECRKIHGHGDLTEIVFDGGV